jgi:tRNA(Ile)-lysidine synthase
MPAAACEPILLTPVEAALRLLSKFSAPARLLIAVSGGSDSIGLLLAFSDALKQYHGPPVTLLAATIDHGLRPEAADEAQYVARFCTDRSVLHVIRRWEGTKPVSGISAAARTARYNLLMEIAEELGADAIVTGHTLDDQFETIAMRQQRSGEDGLAPAQLNGFSLGLAGMAPAVILARRHLLLRPLLSTRRAAIRMMLTEQGIGWIDDPSNIDVRYERARTRQMLHPVTDGQAVLQLNAINEAGLARRGLVGAAAQMVERHITLTDAVLARVDNAAFAEDQAVFVHALATLIAVLGGRSHLIDAERMERLQSWLATGKAGRQTVGRVMLQRRRDGLFLARESRDLTPFQVTPGRTHIWDGRWRIENRGDVVVTVGPHAPDRKAAVERFPLAPPAVALAGLRALPLLEWAGEGERHKVTVEPVLRPFDQFASEFDWKLVNSLAIRVGLACFPPWPFNDFARKS